MKSKSLVAACLLSLALLPACASSGTKYYFSNRAWDFVDILRGHVMAGTAFGVRAEATRFLSLGYLYEDNAWAAGLQNRAVGTWKESIQSWGIILGQYDEVRMVGIPRVSGDYGWFMGSSRGFKAAQPDNPLDLLTVRGTAAVFIGLDLEVRVGEAIDFVVGILTLDPAGDDRR